MNINLKIKDLTSKKMQCYMLDRELSQIECILNNGDRMERIQFLGRRVFHHLDWLRQSVLR